MAVFDCNKIKLQTGSSGDKVKTLQEYLKSWGYYTGKVDSSYGKLTKQAVEAFQRAYKLQVDGWVGTETCKKLNEVANTKASTSSDTITFDCPKVNLKRGMRGEEVKKLQTMLSELGYYQGRIDGEYGYHTYESLREFQIATQHSDDGEFGPKTCPDLVAAYNQKKKKTEAATVKDTSPDYSQEVTYKLTVLPDVVVLPESELDANGNKTSTGGSTDTDTNFDCTKIDLKKGSTGDDVKKLQTILKARGYYTRQIDGEYGKYTVRAVMKLQAAQGNSQDGWFGQKTCNKLQALSATSSKATGTANGKNSNYIITDFIGTPNTNAEVESLSDEVTLNTAYTTDKFNHLRQLQKTVFEIYKGKTLQRKHNGYINSLKVNKEDDQLRIEINLVNYVVFLEQTFELAEDKTAKRSVLLKELTDAAGLKLNLDTTGLNDDEYTLRAQKAASSGGVSEGAGATMTIEEIYAIAAKFGYDGQGTGTCPKKAYDLYKKGVRYFDCYDMTNFLCYMLHTFAKLKCRNLQTYSPSSTSGTHRVAQIYKNGEWICPEQAWNLTPNLRPFRPPEKHGGVQIKYTLEVDDEISC